METRKLGKNGPDVSAIAMGSRLVTDDRHKWEADNLKALAIQFSPDEMRLLNETFTMGAMQGDRYPEALKGMVPS